jgi:hypothetical protein
VVTFANSGADRFGANHDSGTEVTRKAIDLQMFADNFFGIEPSDDGGDDGGEEGVETTQAEDTQTPETQQTQDQQTAATPTTGQSTPAAQDTGSGEADPLAKYRRPDGSLDDQALSRDVAWLNRERGRLTNELGTARKSGMVGTPQVQTPQTPQVPEALAAAGVAEVPQGQSNGQMSREEINRMVVQGLIEDPAGTILSLVAAGIQPVVQPLVANNRQQAWNTESDSWWKNHPDADEAAMYQIANEHPTLKTILALTNPNDPMEPLIPVSQQLELLYLAHRGQAAPEAITKAAEAAANAATVAQVEKASAAMAGGNKAPVKGGLTSTGDPIRDAMLEAAGVTGRRSFFD